MTVHIKFLSALLVVFIAVNCFGENSPRIPGDTVPFGKWKIHKYKIGNTPVGLSASEIKQMMGKYVYLQKDIAIVIGDTCHAPTYNFQVVGDSHFIQYYQINKSFLGISKDQVRILRLDCETEPRYRDSSSPNFSSEFILLSKSEMIISIMGVYFYVQKDK